MTSGDSKENTYR